MAASDPAALGPPTASTTQPSVAGSGELHGRRNRFVRAGRQKGDQVGNAPGRLHDPQTCATHGSGGNPANPRARGAIDGGSDASPRDRKSTRLNSSHLG